MKLLLALLIPLLLPAEAFSFPEMVRHHYVNCNACHVDPGGGGMLTPYGRGMAGEVLSTWSYENESLFLHGALKPEKMPSFLNVGGDVRAVQVHRETKQVREGRYILMQTSLEAGLTAGPVTAVASFGEPDRENHLQGGFTHFYGLAQLTDAWQAKAGRFLPAFGLRDPHHTLSTRHNLGFGYGSNRNTAEAHYSGEQWHAAAGVSQSRLESALRQEEKAAHAQLERFFDDRFRVGLSLWKGKSELQDRWIASLHGMLGFTERWYLLGEFAYQNRRRLNARGMPLDKGIYQFSRLGFEAVRGLHLVALEDISQSSLSAPNTLTVQLGGGVVWYPRPHFEFELTYTQRKILQQSPLFEDYAYLLLHYYL